jgi:GTP-binding protein HflX
MSGTDDKMPGGQPGEGTDEQGLASETEGLGFGPELPRRAVLASVQLPDVSEVDFRESLTELERLASTLGLTVEGEVTQKRQSFDSAAYLGPGRLADLATVVKSRSVPTVVLLDHEVSPSQARQVQKATGAHTVLDRTAVILEIFHRHANSRQAKAQVELVRLQYMAPRLREALKGGDRQRGGIGGKGAGESAMELDRRKLRDRIAQLRDEIDAMQTEHRTRSARRQGLRRVALCGYTNAGKSTLFRALTGSEVYIADKLFATLDTTVRQLHPEPKSKILVSDTIGFIRNLPTKLVASFKTTLDEALEANLILHVIDSADPACERHIATTNAVLQEIGAGDVPQMLVFNKIDKLPKNEDGSEAALPEALLQRFPQHIAISAKRPEDVQRAHAAIVAFFDRDLVEAELLVPYDKQALRGPIFAAAEVLSEEHDEAGSRLRVRIDPIALKQLARDVHVVGAQDQPPTKSESKRAKE